MAIIMEEAKYYNPQLSEFHTGFEFEAYNDNDWFFEESGPGWKKINLNVSGYATFNLWALSQAIIDFKVRVKYLDKEDIKSLGGINIQEDTYEFPFKDPRGYNDKLHIITRGKLKWVLICVGNNETPYSDWDTVFAGEIKNKSELIRVLKMIGAPLK